MFFYSTVPPNAVLTDSSVDQSHNLGESTALMCNSTRGENITFQWQMNGLNITGETAPDLTLSDLSLMDGGNYTCVVTNDHGSDSITTSLFINPNFITQPTDIFLDSGSFAFLRCVAEASPDPTYQWGRVDGGEIRNGITNDTSILTFDPVEFGDEGEYYCNVSSQHTTEVIIRSMEATITG